MPKKWIIILVALVIGGLIACAFGAGGYFWYKEYRLRQTLSIGEAAYARGDWSLARRSFGMYLRKHPKDIDLLVKYADCCYHIPDDRASMLRDARVAYNQIARMDPGNIDAVKRLVSFCHSIGAWRELEYYSTHYLQLNPEQTWLRDYRAIALDELGRTQEAIDAFEELVEQGTEDTEIYLRLAKLLENLGFRGQATELLDDAVLKFSSSPEILAERGLFRLQNGLISEAAADIELALGNSDAMDTAVPLVLLAGARLFEKKEEWSRSAELGWAALKQDPGNIDVHVLLLKAFEKQGQYLEAIEFLEKADPFFLLDHPKLLVFYHELLALTNQLEEARKVQGDFNRAYPTHTMITEYMRGRLLLAEGDASGAADMFTTVVQYSPDFQQAHYFLVVSLLHSHQRQRARNVLETTLLTFPNDSRARTLFEREFSKPNLDAQALRSAQSLLLQDDASALELCTAAEQLFLQGRQLNDETQMDTVRALLVRAIEHEPAFEPAHMALADFYVRTEMLDDARETLRMAEEKIGELEKGSIVRAWIALASNDLPVALREFESELSTGNTDVGDVRRWAESFAVRAGLDAGINVIQVAKERLPADDAKKLRLDELNLSARFRDMDKALAALSKIETAYASGAEIDSALLVEKEQLVTLLVHSGTPEHIADAERIVASLLEAFPGNERYHFLKVQVFVNQVPPDFESAWGLLENMLLADPRNDNVLSGMTDLALEQENILSALDFARRATAANPQNPALHIKLAKVQMRDNKAVEALATLEYVLTINPNSVEALEMLTNAYIATGRLEQADGTLRRLEELPETSDIQWNLSLLRGRIQAARGQNMASVEAALRERYIRNPDDMVALRELSVIVASQKRHSESEQLIMGFAENHPEMEEAWVMQGNYYLARSDDALAQGKASSAFTRALVLRPNYAPALRGLIDLNMQSNSFSQVLWLCDRYLDVYPVSPRILYRKAYLLAEHTKDVPLALETIEQALALEQRREYVFLRGQLRLSLERYEDALADFHEVSRMRAVNSPELDMSLAETYLGIKDMEAAKRYHDAAKVKIDNGNEGNPDRLKSLALRIKEVSEEER
ncbi:tetratricopeptide repeat protein [Candidatus Hydrogenedentota bacterium]